MNKGKIKQIIGSVLDIEFENGELPEIYNALEIETNVSGKKKRSSLRSKPI
ncbi:ATP synthase alpha/beta family, beta-barrel domain protein [Leptospira kirschneri str. 200801925]|nr:ATP synthase alpha/beta family, beta-barrel domain protein [Leptospira kirschneri str. 200801925]